MNRSFRIAVIALAVVALAGCASQQALYPGAHTYPPTDPAKVMVFRTEPPVAYEKLGEIEVEGLGIQTWSSLENGMRKKAAAWGADGLLLLDRSSFVSGYSAYVGNPSTGYSGGQPVHRKHALAIAVKFATPPPLHGAASVRLPQGARFAVAVFTGDVEDSSASDQLSGNLIAQGLLCDHPTVTHVHGQDLAEIHGLGPLGYQWLVLTRRDGATDRYDVYLFDVAGSRLVQRWSTSASQPEEVSSLAGDIAVVLGVRQSASSP
ncbi:MAG TPA: hypothetical protein VNL17_15905 [Verrucomicrobiae bacterium]|nr:hypothetical protein [Verrucomicrobiae bacterium]